EIPCNLVQDLLDNKIEQLEIQIKKMSLFQQELQKYRVSWSDNSNLQSDLQEVCPLISSISIDFAPTN
ncbi:MAG: hypothetical protein RLZZ535_1270, partial [Cyanobacteriota bacterium]